ncbi:hypothetical protein BDW42DRAFT_69416 [Aspergillus taichungensis]|uniref:Uncharacterized protein n=1 Tax=Aspergillus taichungensis TaxID=482145 RepID=A0A2J5I086_9EURO|nr:hypothetical protein BDW42DRAFT_69416 [Aspergillus taichungensis]
MGASFGFFCVCCFVVRFPVRPWGLSPGMSSRLSPEAGVCEECMVLFSLPFVFLRWLEWYLYLDLLSWASSTYDCVFGVASPGSGVIYF